MHGRQADYRIVLFLIITLQAMMRGLTIRLHMRAAMKVVIGLRAEDGTEYVLERIEEMKAAGYLRKIMKMLLQICGEQIIG